MDPTLTRSQAHNVFGELYRKPRSPELQAEVDRIVESSSDIFVRIKRIEELDAREEKKKASESSQESRSGNRGGSRQSSGNGLPPAGAARKGSTRSQVPRKKKSGSGGGLFSGEFWARMFGGELGVWGRKTGTLDTGFMGLRISISPDVAKLFFLLKEDQIISAVKCMRAVMKSGWERWDPAVYNTVVISYQFLNEFVQSSSLITNNTPPGSWINQTIKMQKFYAMFLRYPDRQQILNEDLLNLVSQSPELLPHINGLKSAIQFILTLEDRSPNLTDAILAYYALTTKKIYTWLDIEKQLEVPDPILDRYRASESILSVINGRIKKLQSDISSRQNEIREIEEIKKKYFMFDEKGKITVRFLDEIIEDMGRRIFSDKVTNEGFVKNYRTQPNRLLFMIIRDFDLSAAPLLEGSVTVQGGGGSEEVIIFKQGLKRSWLDEMEAVLRDIDAFNRKNNSFTYDFRRFKEDLSGKPITDAPVAKLHQIIQKASKAMRNITLSLKVVMDNHKMAIAAEQTENAKDKLIRTKDISIESLDVGMRFLPHADRTLISSSRLNGKTVFVALDEVLMNLYNYLYIFKDAEIVKTLAASSKIESEIETMRTELRRMGEET